GSLLQNSMRWQRNSDAPLISSRSQSVRRAKSWQLLPRTKTRSPPVTSLPIREVKHPVFACLDNPPSQVGLGGEICYLPTDRITSPGRARGSFMDYATAFSRALQPLKEEGRYRVFADIRRNRGHFPSARHFAASGPRQITVWCSNDYLGMAEHPGVIAAMHEALDTAGAGSGGTRNISGTSHYHVELEAELAYLHSKDATLLFTSAYVARH